MPGMNARVLCLLLAMCAAPTWSDTPPLTEDSFRKGIGVDAAVHLAFRGPDCKTVSFDTFAAAMRGEGARADVDRAIDGKSITLTVRLRGSPACPAPYPPVSVMPPFDLQDLAGKRVTSASLRGKPTLVNFYFAKCKPCILEVQPLNSYARAHPGMNFLAVTFDEPAEARAFVARYGFRWRVMPGAQDFIDRMRVKQYPTLALFDAQGRLLGTRKGGVKDALEAATIEPQVTRWVEGLLRGAN